MFNFSEPVTWGDIWILLLIHTFVAPFLAGFIRAAWRDLRGGGGRRNNRGPFAGKGQ